MQELAGEAAVLLPPDWEEASSTVSGGPEGEEGLALTAAQVRWGAGGRHAMAARLCGGCRHRGGELAACPTVVAAL